MRVGGFFDPSPDPAGCFHRQLLADHGPSQEHAQSPASGSGNASGPAAVMPSASSTDRPRAVSTRWRWMCAFMFRENPVIVGADCPGTPIMSDNATPHRTDLTDAAESPPPMTWWRWPMPAAKAFSTRPENSDWNGFPNGCAPGRWQDGRR